VVCQSCRAPGSHADIFLVEHIMKQQREERQVAAEAALSVQPQSTVLVFEAASIGSMPGGFEKEKPPSRP
jgi:hypothetical protein